MKKKSLILCLFLLFLSNLFCTENFFVIGAKVKIKILYYKTDYKTVLIKKLVNILNENKMNVVTDLAANINNNTAPYDALIILSDIQRGHRQDEILKFINSLRRTDNILLVDTDKSYSNYSKIKNVDSWTAGSDKSNIDIVTKKILSKLKIILKLDR